MLINYHNYVTYHAAPQKVDIQPPTVRFLSATTITVIAKIDVGKHPVWDLSAHDCCDASLTPGGYTVHRKSGQQHLRQTQ